MRKQARRLDDWLDAHLKYTEWSESPVSFHMWAGLSCISSMLQRKVHIQWGMSPVYPNQYVVLVGPSGRSRKGEPLLLARNYLDRLNLPILGEDNSVESVVKDLADSLANYMEGKTIRFQCASTAIVEELAVFLGNQNTRFLSYLTQWYDCRDRWKRKTKHQGIDEIVGVCVNMLASTAPDWFPYMFPQEVIGGGFTSRCIFVVEDRKSRVVPNPNKHPLDRSLFDSLVHDLEVMHTMVGEFHFNADALQLYTDWYSSEETKTQGGQATISDPSLEGYASRRATHAKKIAMALSASRGSDLTISEHDFRRALALMEQTERRMAKVFAGIGKPRFLEETELVLEYLQQKGSATRAEIMRHFFRKLDDMSMSTVAKVLGGMKLVREERDVKGHDLIYTFLGEASQIVTPLSPKQRRKMQ